MASVLARIDRFVAAYNNWLASRWGFLQAILVTILWVPFVVYKIDPHGFIYLYCVSAFATISLFGVAIIARRAQRSADEATEQMLHILVALRQMMENDSAQMAFLVALAEETRQEQLQHTEMIEDLNEAFDHLAPEIPALVVAGNDGIPPALAQAEYLTLTP